MSDMAERILPDAEARRRIRTDLDATFFVEAAAGTGKTTALVSRIVSVLRSGRGVLERMVAVTFTEKAAGELKLRLRAAIEEARTDEKTPPEERARLETSLEQLELSRIGTIHAFCGDLLHERPVEAGVDPLFGVSPEDESQRLIEQAFDRWFTTVLADLPEGVRRILRRRPRGWGAPGPRDLLLNAVRSLVEHRDFPAPYRRPTLDRPRRIDELMDEFTVVGALADRGGQDDWLAKSLQKIDLFVTEQTQLEAVRGRDYDGLEAALRDFAWERSWNWKGFGKRYGDGLDRATIKQKRDDAKVRLDAFLADADAHLAACLKEELAPVVAAYGEMKAQAGQLDFLDLLICARDLIAGDDGVRVELAERFTHFFVDEFQDTDPLQAEIVALLTSDDPAERDWKLVRPLPGKLFVVGDPKQSIYRFRRADVATYEATKRQLVARGAEVLNLTTSFRSLPALQAAINGAFAPAMRGNMEGSQAEYVALEPFREDEDRPAFIALPVPRPYSDWGKPAKWKVDESYPDAVGAWIDWLINKSGWTIEGRPVEERDVCILLRRFRSYRDDVTRPYVRALEARGVAHVLVGGRSFHDREEVLALRNALNAIEWPDDELRVFATLRGPFFALGDDQLLAWRHCVGRFHALRRLPAEEYEALEEPVQEVADAIAILSELHYRRNHRPIAKTLTRLLAAVRAHAGIAIWPTGEQALANCLRVVERARKFERRGAPSFRAFVTMLEEEAESGEAEDAPVVEEGTEGVRIMTVHRAKGLEFPVVILADPTCRETRETPSRHVDPDRELWAEALCGCVPLDLLDARDEELRRDQEEAIRLAYVAATRARDILVVPAIGDERFPGDRDELGSWIDVLKPVIFPVPSGRRDSDPAPGCPEFGEDSVVERGEKARTGTYSSVKPGLHHPQSGKGRVVWWDPSKLDLLIEAGAGATQMGILSADQGADAAAAGVKAHQAWQDSRNAALLAGIVPSLRVASVTTVAAEMESVGGVALEEVEIDRQGRPGGRRFGTLVHAGLAAALPGEEEAVPGILHVQGRLLGATDEEIEAAVLAVRAALAHPLLQRAGRAAATGGLKRETPLVLRRADGSLAEGVVDLAFREDGVWTVVDFKTDRDLSDRRPEYEAQVLLYAEAISKATGEPARPVLLLV